VTLVVDNQSTFDQFLTLKKVRIVRTEVEGHANRAEALVKKFGDAHRIMLAQLKADEGYTLPPALDFSFLSFTRKLKDFFPSVTFRRVKGFFRKVGYNEHVATVLSLLCTEPPRAAAKLDGRRIWVAVGQRVLPQGACTSPALTNLLCRRLDARLTGLARRHSYAFTRYADDLTFSGNDPKALGGLMRSTRTILGAEGFVEAEAKTKVQHRAGRQEVTGVVVNTKPSVPREERRALRAILYNAAKHGIESQNRGGHASFAAHLRGRVAYVAMIDAAQGERLRALLDRALAAQG
jgi:hypothetical protein